MRYALCLCMRGYNGRPISEGLLEELRLTKFGVPVVFSLNQL